MGKRTGRPRGRPKGPWPLKALRDGIRIALMRRMPDGRRRLDVFAERMGLRDGAVVGTGRCGPEGRADEGGAAMRSDCKTRYQSGPNWSLSA